MALINPPPPKGYDPRAQAVENFTLRNCRLLAGDRQSSDTHFAYLQALAVPRFRNVQILDNDIVGSVNLGDLFWPSFRLECIGNTIQGGGNTDNVSLNVSQVFDSIVDGNQLRHAATRFLVNARRHCAIRFNEVHDYQRGIWANAEETFLVHGDVFKGGGRATAATETTLTDRAKQWRSGLWRDAEVLIVSGRGFGQHRTVTDNVISHTPRGLSVSDTARKTFLLRNAFEQVDPPILDWGRDTVQQGNVVRMLDQDGERTVAVPNPAMKTNAKGVSP